MEKSKGLCRQIVLPTIRDALVLQCLSDAFYADIKGKAPTKKSFFEPEDHAFSVKRAEIFSQPGYGSFRSWLNFQQEIFRFARNRKYIVVTDIANYYDTIAYTHLRNIVSSTIDVRESLLDMLIFILSGLLWQPDYMPRVEVGLPQINIDAPRVLAHCFLYELDKFLQGSFGGDYVRFMDDIDIGVDTLAEAKSILRDVDLILQTRQVRLNSGKTKILKSEDAIRHFWVRENHLLDRVEDRINKKSKNGRPITREQKKISDAVLEMYREERFEQGNGEKILKRMITMTSRMGGNIDHSVFIDVLWRRPGCRQALLSHVSKRPLTRNFLDDVSKFLDSGLVVDDCTKIYIANAIVDSPVLAHDILGLGIQKVMKSLTLEKFSSIYGVLWMSSKYANASTLLKVLRDTSDEWQSDSWLGRLVGGLAPVFYGTQEEPAYRNLVERFGNAGAAITYQFHCSLRDDPKHFNGVAGFLRATNTSRYLSITNAKFLMLMSALRGKAVTTQAKSKLIKIYEGAWQDVFYRDFGQRIVRPVTLRAAIK